MNEKEIEKVIEAIQKAPALGSDGDKKGVDLLAIAKKVSRNRRKGETLE